MYSKRSRPSRLVAAQTLMTSLSLIRIPTVVTATGDAPLHLEILVDSIDVFLLATPKCVVHLCVPDTPLPVKVRHADLASIV